MTREEQQEQLNLLYIEMNNLESELKSNDYKNVKNGEAERANKPLPYDPLGLYTENQAKRDRINEIEEEIEILKAFPVDDEQEEHILPEVQEEVVEKFNETL